jgi:hypothetical protein
MLKHDTDTDTADKAEIFATPPRVRHSEMLQKEFIGIPAMSSFSSRTRNIRNDMSRVVR